MVSTEVLELILAARYIGRPAFSALSQDIEGVVQQSNALTRVGALFSALGDTMIAAGVGVGVGLAAAVKQATEFEQSMQRIQTVTGYTPDQMKNLQQIILNLSDQYGQSSQDIAQASYITLSGMQALGAGWQDVMNNNILPSIAAYVEASGAGQLGSVSWAQAAQNVTTILAGLHQPVASWTQDLGDLTMVENNAHVTQQNLVQSMLRFAPMAGLLNMPFDQTAAIAGALATAGVPGARAGTELTSGYRTLVSGKGASATQLAQFGLTPESFFGQNGQIDSLQNIMGILMPHLAGLNTSQRIGALNNLFGAAGGRAFNELLTSNTNGGPSAMGIYQTLLGKERNAPGGAANAMFAEAGGIASGPQATFDKLKASLQNLAIVVGQQLLPTLQQWATWLIDHIKTLTDFITKNPQVVGEVAKAVPALIGGGIGMRAMGGAFSFLGSPAGKSGLTLGRKFLGGFGSTIIGPLEEGQARPSGLLGIIQSIFSGGAGVGHGVASGIKGGAKGVGHFLNMTTEETSAAYAGMKHGAGTKALGFLHGHFPTAMANMFMEQAAEHDKHPALGFLGGAAKDIGGMAKGGAKNMFGGLAGGIKNLVTGIPALLGMLPELAAGFAAVAVPVLIIIAIIAIVVLTFLTFRHEAMQTAATIGKQLQPVFQFFAAVFQQAVKSIEKAWSAAWPSIEKAMMSLFANLPKIVPLLQLVGGIIGGVFAIVAAVIVGLVNGVIKALPYIIGFISSIISFVGDFVKIIIDLFTNWGALKGDIANLFGDIWGIISNAAGAIWGLLSGFVMGIIGFFQFLWNTLTRHSIIPDMINDIFQWFLKLPVLIPQVILNLIISVISQFAQWELQMIQWGEQLIMGLVQGLLNAIPNVLSAVGNVASSVIGGFKSLFGISSPSTVMAGFGGDLNQGLANGLNSSQSLPLSAATSTANGVTGTFSNMATTGCGSFADLQNCANTHTAQMTTQVGTNAEKTKLAVLNHEQDLLTQSDAKLATMPGMVKHHMDDVNKVLQTSGALSSQNSYNLGAQMMQGVANGIYAKKQAAMIAADDAANSINTAFTRHMRISSPSRLFYEHGENTILGYVQGLAAHQKDLLNAWANLTPPQAGGGPISVNVSVPHRDMHPSQASYSGALAVQQERYNRQSNVQNITQSSLLRQIDLQYRYAYQASA